VGFLGSRAEEQIDPSVTRSALRSLIAFVHFRVRAATYFFVITSNNFETATWRTLTIALLSDLQPYYFGPEGFRESANFRMLSDSRSQRTTLATDDKLFVFLLNTCNSAYGSQVRSPLPTRLAMSPFFLPAA
jgi:hypothetical protein